MRSTGAEERACFSASKLSCAAAINVKRAFAGPLRRSLPSRQQPYPPTSRVRSRRVQVAGTCVRPAAHAGRRYRPPRPVPWAATGPGPPWARCTGPVRAGPGAWRREESKYISHNPTSQLHLCGSMRCSQWRKAAQNSQRARTSEEQALAHIYAGLHMYYGMSHSYVCMLHRGSMILYMPTSYCVQTN